MLDRADRQPAVCLHDQTRRANDISSHRADPRGKLILLQSVAAPADELPAPFVIPADLTLSRDSRFLYVRNVQDGDLRAFLDRIGRLPDARADAAACPSERRHRRHLQLIGRTAPARRRRLSAVRVEHEQRCFSGAPVRGADVGLLPRHANEWYICLTPRLFCTSPLRPSMTNTVRCNKFRNTRCHESGRCRSGQPRDVEDVDVRRRKETACSADAHPDPRSPSDETAGSADHVARAGGGRCHREVARGPSWLTWPVSDRGARRRARR